MERGGLARREGSAQETRGLPREEIAHPHGQAISAARTARLSAIRRPRLHGEAGLLLREDAGAHTAGARGRAEPAHETGDPDRIHRCSVRRPQPAPGTLHPPPPGGATSMNNGEKEMPGPRMVRATICLLAIAAFAAPNVAEAQIGNLIKRKAAEKVAKKVDEAVGKKDSTPPQAQAGARGRDGRRREPLQPVNETIDASTLDALLAGLKAMTVKLRQADSLHRVVASNGGVDSVALRDAARYATELEQKRPCFDMAFEQVDYQRLQDASRIAHAPSASVER